MRNLHLLIVPLVMHSFLYNDGMDVLLFMFIYQNVYSEKLNSMNLLLYMAPIAIVVLLPATLIMESNVLGITITLAKQDPRVILYLLVNSVMAYFVNLTNFLVTKHTSPLTLQVCYLFSVLCSDFFRD